MGKSEPTRDQLSEGQLSTLARVEGSCDELAVNGAWSNYADGPFS